MHLTPILSLSWRCTWHTGHHSCSFGWKSTWHPHSYHPRHVFRLGLQTFWWKRLLDLCSRKWLLPRQVAMPVLMERAWLERLWLEKSTKMKLKQVQPLLPARRLYPQEQRHEFETKKLSRKKQSVPSYNLSLQTKLHTRKKGEKASERRMHFLAQHVKS